MSSHPATANAQETRVIKNTPAVGVSYFTPAQNPPSGTASDPQPNGQSPPKLFQPLTIRGLTFQNRIFLSPMCQYSAEDGHLTAWHMAHLGGIISRGPGLATVEATAVLPEGRITPEDVGLWKDSQIEPMAKIVEFARSQNQKIAIQLSHAGRKASAVAPWLSTGGLAVEEAGGWPNNVCGPSAIAYDGRHAQPHEMTFEDIENLKKAWVAATRRALKAGFDAVEIHNAHGYLLHSFISPASNKRTDAYGGCFENRTRLTREIVDLVRAEIPDSMPLFLRISATDWLEHTGEPSWTVDQTAELAKVLADKGVDLIDVSSGGLHPAQKIVPRPGFQAPLAKRVREAVAGKALVSATGMITEGKQAQALVDDGSADVIMSGRQFQRNPGLVWAWADDLGVKIYVANQIGWGFGKATAAGGRGGRRNQ